jgi:hypothetical protein
MDCSQQEIQAVLSIKLAITSNVTKAKILKKNAARLTIICALGYTFCFYLFCCYIYCEVNLIANWGTTGMSLTYVQIGAKDPEVWPL